jgi:DNA-binding beta-propeller fold protein YncE
VTNDGANPPTDELYFPVALALSPAETGEAPAFLYVANANFDLRYNAGTVQAFDLEKITEEIPDDCDDCVLAPLGDSLVSSVRIGSQAGALAVAPAGDRLFVPVREDRNLTTINVDPASGVLACGGTADGHECSGAFRSVDIGGDGEAVSLGGEIVDVHVGPLADLGLEADVSGDYLFAVHRSGQITLLSDRVEAGTASLTDRRVPRTVASLPTADRQLASVRFDVADGLAWVTNARNRTVARFGVAADRVESEELFAQLYAASTPVVSGVDSGSDTRDVVFEDFSDGSKRAYLLSRDPAAVLVADFNAADNARLRVSRVIAVGQGPSKLESARVTIRGEERLLLFASCYTSRDVYVVDPTAGGVLAVIRGANGPFSLAYDGARQRLYVADFRAAVIRVVSLVPLLDCLETGLADAAACEPVALGTIGEPNVIGDSF